MSHAVADIATIRDLIRAFRVAKLHRDAVLREGEMLSAAIPPHASWCGANPKRGWCDKGCPNSYGPEHGALIAHENGPLDVATSAQWDAHEAADHAIRSAGYRVAICDGRVYLAVSDGEVEDLYHFGIEGGSALVVDCSADAE